MNRENWNQQEYKKFILCWNLPWKIDATQRIIVKANKMLKWVVNRTYALHGCSSLVLSASCPLLWLTGCQYIVRLVFCDVGLSWWRTTLPSPVETRSHHFASVFCHFLSEVRCVWQSRSEQIYASLTSLNKPVTAFEWSWFVHLSQLFYEFPDWQSFLVQSSKVWVLHVIFLSLHAYRIDQVHKF